MRMTTLAAAYASTLQAVDNCTANGNEEWLDRWQERLIHLNGMMPSGSGLDSGVTLDFDLSEPNKLVFNAPYHQMDENGYYDGWVDNTITITPGFDGHNIAIVAENEDHADYLCEMFLHVLTEPVSADSTYPADWPGRDAKVA